MLQIALTGKADIGACLQSIARFRPKVGCTPAVFCQSFETVYGNLVSPHRMTLKRSPGKDETYGEVLPSLVAKLVDKISIRSHHTFLDLGCGFGNVAMQFAAQVGCAAYGIENVSARLQIGLQVLEELRSVLSEAGVTIGDVSLELGDLMALSKRHLDLMEKADVFFFNNLVMGPERE
jgi:H3 lysine-79-specific histone-lysine N-methyltransferase